MTTEEAAAILGPELTAQIREQAAKAEPLTAAQIALLVGLINHPDTELAERATA